MDKKEIRHIIINCLDTIGVFIDEDDNVDLDLREYIEDSMQFLLFMVELEKKLNIKIPDDFLLFDKVSSLNAYCEMISACLE